MLLQSALVAEKLVCLKMNIPENLLDKIIKLLPSLNAPTIASLYKSTYYSVETVVDSNMVRSLIPKLLKEGAEGIIEYSLNKVL